MKVAVVGATGLVGQAMIRILEERRFPVSKLVPVASEKSSGETIPFQNGSLPIITMEEGLEEYKKYGRKMSSLSYKSQRNG